MSRYELLLDKLIKGETADIIPRSRAEQALLNCIDKCGCEGLPTPRSNAEAYLQALAEQIKEGGSDGKLTEISTAAEMDTILTNATSADIGKAYLYIGETTEAYENNAIYIIKETE